MQRMQVQLTEEQLFALRALSAQQNRSIADLVRESVDSYVSKASSPPKKFLIERAKRAAGIFASGVSDVSERHDDYLVDAFS